MRGCEAEPCRLFDMFEISFAYETLRDIKRFERDDEMRVRNYKNVRRHGYACVSLCLGCVRVCVCVYLSVWGACVCVRVYQKDSTDVF